MSLDQSPQRGLICLTVLFLSSALVMARAADPAPKRASIVIHADRQGPKVSPMLWGIFFEDINCSADGGIYAELVRNRSFEDSDRLEHWTVTSTGKGKVEAVIDTSRPISPRNKRALRLSADDISLTVEVANDGFWGVPVRKGEEYRLSLWARGQGALGNSLIAAITGRDGKSYGQKVIHGLTHEWERYECSIVASQTDPKARLAIAAAGKGTLWLDMVSLFPAKTWKNRSNGLRPDLAEMLADLRPRFVRFPGGCWVEGDTMKFAYRWKETIGDPSQRRTQYNIWRYHATNGLGFHEYLQMCEDLGAEPLFVINCGMSHRENVPMDRMEEFVQDALDAIEYCNGPAESGWGKIRAENGHPEPFRLRYMEIGNENGGPAYQERYALFYDAIKKRFPEMTLISNVPTETRPADIVDEHYYSSPEFFIRQADRYDRYDREGPGIYVGEYAVTQGCGRGNLRAAVGEAAFMTGMERNSDVVVMSSYAPLFVNVNHRGWNPDLINFDGERAYGTPSYHVQKMFGDHTGDVIVPLEVEAPSIEAGPKGGAVGVGTWSTQAEFKDMKVTRGGQTLWSADLSAGTAGWKLLGGEWKADRGVLRQSARGENIRAVAGDKAWTDYTFSLKARKLGGAEGFLVLFRVQDENAKSWWNIGGWGNTRHAVEMGGEIGRSVPGQIETGRWYEIRVEVEGSAVRCYLDGKLVHDLKTPSMRALHASATRVSATGELVLKVVNSSARELGTEITVQGAGALAAAVPALVLTSGDPADENSLDHPTRVVPAARQVDVSGSSIHHPFPGNSVSVIRLKPR